MSALASSPAKETAHIFIPREHGAIAMLLTPFFAAAILMRRVYWPELVALAAIAGVFAIKDPLVVLARQRFVWKQEHSETRTARRTAAMEALLLLVCGIALMLVGNWRTLVPLFLGAAGFTVLVVIVTVRNKQRSEWFQVASAAALSATSLMACVSAIGSIPEWCCLLWILCALQAAAGIFVVHARLDARIAARKNITVQSQSRRVAFVAQAVLILAGVLFGLFQQFWIAAALVLAALLYLLELRRQKQQRSLQISLKSVGLLVLAQSTVYTLILIVGLWR